MHSICMRMEHAVSPLRGFIVVGMRSGGLRPRLSSAAPFGADAAPNKSNLALQRRARSRESERQTFDECIRVQPRAMAFSLADQPEG